MDLITNSVPLCISLLFLVCMAVPILMLSAVVKTVLSHPNMHAYPAPKNLPRTIVVFFALYFLYTTVLSQTGILSFNTLPPRVLVLTAIPLSLFYFLVVFRSKTFWMIFEHTSLSSLVRLHIFRFVGVFFLVGWWYNILPKSFAHIAGIGDIITAASAALVASLIDQKLRSYKTITLLWNIFGTCDILSVIVSAIYTTKLAIDNNSTGVLEMSKFPFILIPAFAPATIIFLHVCIFVKLKRQKANELEVAH